MYVSSIDGREVPNWHGIEGVGYIYHGEWSDPEIEYKGKRFNIHDVEYIMRGCFCIMFGSEHFHEFSRYIEVNTQYVYDILNELIEQEEV